MMKLWRALITIGLLAGLAACAPDTSRQKEQPGTSRPAPPPVEAVDLDFSALTGAEIIPGAQPQIIYRQGRLYQAGAALPGPEGLGHLEVLADWLKGTAQSRWLVKVNAETVDGGAEPMLLAEKRQELLVRFFRRKGLEPNGWQWQTASGGDAQLIFELPESP